MLDIFLRIDAEIFGCPLEGFLGIDDRSDRCVVDYYFAIVTFKKEYLITFLQVKPFPYLNRNRYCPLADTLARFIRPPSRILEILYAFTITLL